MAQSHRMAASPGPPPLRSRRTAHAGRVAIAIAAAAIGVSVILVPPAAAHASGNEGAAPAGDEVRDALERSTSRERAEARLRLDEDDGDNPPRRSLGGSMGLGSLTGRSGLFGMALLVAAFYFFFMRGRGAGGASAGWGSYYLFWIIAPAVLAAVSAHPEFLIVVVIGLVARRWLPDPFLILKHRARVRSLQIDIDTNASNVTARRDLAKIWLEKHRPRREIGRAHV